MNRRWKKKIENAIYVNSKMPFMDLMIYTHAKTWKLSNTFRRSSNFESIIIRDSSSARSYSKIKWIIRSHRETATYHLVTSIFIQDVIAFVTIRLSRQVPHISCLFCQMFRLLKWLSLLSSNKWFVVCLFSLIPINLKKKKRDHKYFPMR